jgi:hypothetical protein
VKNVLKRKKTRECELVSGSESVALSDGSEPDNVRILSGSINGREHF